jgi:hypothetical protein
MVEAPSATITFAIPVYVEVNGTIFALRAVPASADPAQTAATVSSAAMVAKRNVVNVTPFVEVLM